MHVCHLAERDQPPLLSLAERGDDAAPNVDVAEPQGHELRHAQAGCIREAQHGAVPQPTLADFYRRATAVIVPSVNEGLGLVAVEAQLCEAPVIAFDSGGLPDVVQHDRTGILVADVTAGALAAAVVSLLERDDRGASLGAASRLHALSTFAPESVARRYADIYRAAIASSPPK